MTHERHLQIARKIVLDGIQKELTRLGAAGFLGMPRSDEAAIRSLVQSIAHGIHYVEFQASGELWSESWTNRYSTKWSS